MNEQQQRRWIIQFWILDRLCECDSVFTLAQARTFWSNLKGMEGVSEILLTYVDGKGVFRSYEPED